MPQKVFALRREQRFFSIAPLFLPVYSFSPPRYVPLLSFKSSAPGRRIGKDDASTSSSAPRRLNINPSAKVAGFQSGRRDARGTRRDKKLRLVAKHISTNRACACEKRAFSSHGSVSLDAIHEGALPPRLQRIASSERDTVVTKFELNRSRVTDPHPPAIRAHCTVQISFPGWGLARISNKKTPLRIISRGIVQN